MNIKFGKIKKRNWEPEDFISKTGKSGKEKHFYFEVTGGNDNDDIRISDTCGRSIPIDIEHLSELINALLLIEVNS